MLGNAADHSATVFMAMKNKMDAAYNITTGSSVQVALFVAPILLLASYFISPAHPLNFEFSTLELVAIGMGAGGIVLTSHDGDIHWVEGGMLITILHHAGGGFLLPAGDGGVSAGSLHRPRAGWPGCRQMRLFRFSSGFTMLFSHAGART